MNDFTHPTLEQQVPSYRLFTLDIIRAKELTIDENGQEFHEYLGVKIYCPDRTVKRFYPSKNLNFGEMFIAQAWAIGQMDFLNKFWDVDDYKMIFTPEASELLHMSAQAMQAIGEDYFHKKAMQN